MLQDQSLSQIKLIQPEKELLNHTQHNNAPDPMKIKLYCLRFGNYFLREKKRYKALTPFQHHIIHDTARKESYSSQGILREDNQWGKQKKSKFERFKRRMARKLHKLKKSGVCLKLSQLASRVPCINPNSLKKIIWDFILAIVRFYLLIVIPLEISFNTKLLYNQLVETVYLCMFLLAIDIVLNFMTAYYEKGHLVTRFSKIAVNYLTFNFIFDFVCILSLIIVISEELDERNSYIEYPNQHQRVFDNGRDFISLFGILFQLKNIIRLFDRLSNQDLSETITLLVDLVKMVMFLFLLEHVFTCIWYFVGVRVEGETWLTKMELDKSSYTVQYITAFYFASVTMFTVGYGDVVPQNQYERLVTISFMIFSTLQLSYTVSAIWAIYQKLNEKADLINLRMRTINQYMRHMNISIELRQKIREYLIFYLKEITNEDDTQVKEVLASLSPDLQERLQFEANSMIVQGCKLFKENFSHEFKIDLLKCVNSSSYTPGKPIFIEEPAVFFVERGSVVVKHPIQQKQLLRVFRKGENFGLREFLLNMLPQTTFHAETCCKLMYITHQQFAQLLQKHPLDQEIFFKIRDTIVFSQSPYASECYACRSDNHNLQQCPYVTYQPDAQLAIKRAAYPQVQQRNDKYVRRAEKQKKGRTVMIKEIKLDEERRKDTLPSVDSDDSSELELRESWVANHHDYFKLRKVLRKQPPPAPERKVSRQPIEICQVEEVDQNSLKEKDHEQMTQLKMKINSKHNFEIDEIKNYKYYWPEYNVTSFRWRSVKLEQQLVDSWTRICYYLTFPYLFMKKFRGQLVYNPYQEKGQGKPKRQELLNKRGTIITFTGIKS